MGDKYRLVYFVSQFQLVVGLVAYANYFVSEHSAIWSVSVYGIIVGAIHMAIASHLRWAMKQ